MRASDGSDASDAAAGEALPSTDGAQPIADTGPDASTEFSALLTEFASDKAAMLRGGPRLLPSAKCAVTKHEQHVEVNMRFAHPRQRILGFGGAMTHSSASLILGHPAQERILDELFLPVEKGGSGLCCVRVAVGSSDFALSPPFTHRSERNSLFDASRDREHLLPVLSAAKLRNPHIQLIGSPWSAPHFMKTSLSLNHGTLEEDSLLEYAQHLLQVILFFAEEGLPLYAITLQNEPYHEAWSYPSMKLSAIMQARLGRELVTRLRFSGLDTRVLGHDHNYDLVDDAVTMLRIGGDWLDGSAWHAYKGDPSAPAHEVIQQHPIYFTEQTAHTQRPRDADFVGDCNWAMRNVTLGPVLQGARCALQWNLVLDEAFGPVLPGVDTKCRGLLEVSNGGSVLHEHERSPEWYVMAHMSHASAFGRWRVDTELHGLRDGRSGNDKDAVACAGFIGEDRCAGVVLHNPGTATITVSLPQFTTSIFELPGASILSINRLHIAAEERLRIPPADEPKVRVSPDVHCRGDAGSR